MAPRRPGSQSPLMPIAIAVGAVAILAVLWVTVLRDLSLFGPQAPSMEGLVAVPTPARQIPAYTRVTRDHFWDPVNARLTVVYLPPGAVTKEMLVRLPDVLGRVLNRAKAPGYVFTDADFMPDGTREGIVAGIPAGKRAIRIPSDEVEGLFGLHAGDRFDLVATMPIDQGDTGGAGQAFDFGGVFAEQLALEARLSNWQKQATVQVIAQNGIIVEAMTTRQIPVTQAAAAEGARARSRLAEEVVIAVNPDEVARLTEAMAVRARIWLVPRSGRPDDPVDSETPDLRPVSPFSDGSDAAGGDYRVVETIMGQRRELTAVPKP